MGGPVIEEKQIGERTIKDGELIGIIGDGCA